MSHLALVKQNDHSRVLELVSEFEGIMDKWMTVTPATYGTERPQAMVYVTNEDTGLQLRVIFDLLGLFGNRQGVHTGLMDLDEYDLADKLDEAHSDGFDTIWVHS